MEECGGQRESGLLCPIELHRDGEEEGGSRDSRRSQPSFSRDWGLTEGEKGTHLLLGRLLCPGSTEGGQESR